jgi:hypothetical protein
VSVVPITTGAPTSPELLPAPDKEYGLTDNPAVSFDDEEQLATDTSDYERSITGTPLLGSPLISFEEGANDAEEAAAEGSSPATTSSSLSLLDLDFGPPSTDGLSLMVRCQPRRFVYHRFPCTDLLRRRWMRAPSPPPTCSTFLLERRLRTRSDHSPPVRWSGPVSPIL